MNIEQSSLAAAGLMWIAVAGGCVPENVRTQHTINPIRIDTIRLEYSNAHLVRAGNDAFLVDTGPRTTIGRLEAELRAAGVEPADLRAVILTHGHADHAGAAAHLQRLGVPIIAGAADRDQLSAGGNDRLCPTDGSARDRLAADQAAHFDPVTPDVLIHTSTSLREIAGVDGRIVPLPGHTPGSLVVIFGRATFVGDLVRGEILSNGADVHFYMCDLEDNRADLGLLLEEIAPETELFFVGHFGPISQDHVRDLLREVW